MLSEPDFCGKNVDVLDRLIETTEVRLLSVVQDPYDAFGEVLAKVPF